MPRRAGSLVVATLAGILIMPSLAVAQSGTTANAPAPRRLRPRMIPISISASISPTSR